MNSSYSISWLILSGALYGAWILWVLCNISWQNIRQDTTAQHLFFGSIFALSCLWQIRGGIKPGLEVHFLGVTAAVLFMGWPLGILAATGALISATGFGWMPWSELGLQGFLQVGLPAGVTWCGYRLSQRYLPPNPFIYLMVCAFFVAGFAMGALVLAKAATLWIANIYSWDIIYHNYVRYLVLMMFPEAFLNGAIMGAFFLISPHWIATFDEDVFFHDNSH
jgi:uncharacterized membrane protein